MLSKSGVFRTVRSAEGGRMIMKGRAISPGYAEGEAITYKEPFSFLGGVDGKTGKFNVRDGTIDGKVFLFPNGKGSTVGSYVVYDLMVQGHAPAALVNRNAETIVTTGAVISSVPMVDGVDISLVKDGDKLVVDGNKGYVELKNVTEVNIISAMIVVNGKFLILHRPSSSRSYPDKWSLVSGHVEYGESFEETSRREILEETQISVSYPNAECPPFRVREGNTIYNVHTFLYLLPSAEVKLNHENTEFKWVSLDEVDISKMVDGIPVALEAFKKYL